MENGTDICVIMWKVCEYVKMVKKNLLDCGHSSKDDFHLRWRESSKCNSVLFTGDMACSPCKEDFLSLKQSEQTVVHLFVGWWNDDTYWDWSEACSIVHNGGSPLQLQNWLPHQRLPLSIFCTDQCTNVTLDPWWDWGNAVSKRALSELLICEYSQIIYIYIFLQSWWGWIQLIIVM